MAHWLAQHSGGHQADICLLHCTVIASVAVLVQQRIGIFAMQINILNTRYMYYVCYILGAWLHH